MKIQILRLHKESRGPFIYLFHLSLRILAARLVHSKYRIERNFSKEFNPREEGSKDDDSWILYVNCPARAPYNEPSNKEFLP